MNCMGNEGSPVRLASRGRTGSAEEPPRNVRREYRLALVAVLLAGASILPRTGEAAVVGAGTYVQDSSGTTTNGMTCIYTTPSSPTYDVFGTTVNTGHVFCLRPTTNGVPGTLHCEAADSPGLLSFDSTTGDALNGTSVCLDPPTCSYHSFITQISNVSGSSQDEVLSNLPAGTTVVYTLDVKEGPGILVGGASPIPGCPTLGPGYLHRTGSLGVNAFLVQSTDVGSNVSTATNTTFFNPINEEEAPITVDVQFSEVGEAGSTTVIGQSNDDTDLPANFAYGVDGFQASFLQISTTAAVTPPITICTHYPDADNDGLIDGTSVPESLLSFLHGEGDPPVYVDRTSSRDVDANEICGEVDHLSPFVAAVRESLCGSAPRTGCRSAAKSLFKSVQNPDAHKKDVLLWKWINGEPTLPSEFGDPTTSTGTELCIFDQHGLVLEAAVPKASRCGSLAEPCWSAVSGKGFKFKDKAGLYDGVKRIILRGNDSAPKSRVVLKGSGNNLLKRLSAFAPPVTVQLVNDHQGGACFEAVYGADQVLSYTDTTFKAKTP
jgi:hypothetical protein